ncbi:NfeD family protein [Desulfosarcina sp.]|uniref:NfeD family protein n=1 Tax=Desulfosarcina sp. TaxID=2027861 RepID=UPI0029B85FB8|nr:NfeD family protein [Desulfosarcina sp.]MDX2451912.1 NfeD family protein [Desulfosarcina sp.]MDX2489702.1 NfeD family protein [Desulfosarcina sp.]
MARSQQKPANVFVIPISGDVEPGMAAFLKRALNDVPDTADTVIVVEMNTFGGRVDSALEMVDALINVKNAKTIAFVTNKAISAGALISLACNQLVMKNNTTIGDCAPITYSKEGPKMMGEKFQSPLRAKFRTLAKRNGYPAVLAEAMVSVDMEVYRVKLEDKLVFMDAQEYQDLDKDQQDSITSKKTVVAKGELLTMDDSEAHDLGFSSMSVASLEEMLKQMDLSDQNLTRIQESWSENLVSFIGMLSPILMLIGLGSLYTEIKAPGFGAPGIIGILCLALVFFNQYLVGLANFTELLIVMIGIVLMGFEIFVFPGFGISGIAGIVCITAGLLLSLQDFVIPDPNLPWEKELLINNMLRVLSSVLGSFLFALFLLRYVFPRISKTVQGPYLAATLADARLDLPVDTSLQAGQTGTAITLLRPSGKATIDGERYDVVTQGDFVPKGSKIRVATIKGTKIVVVRIDTDE